MHHSNPRREGAGGASPTRYVYIFVYPQFILNLDLPVYILTFEAYLIEV